MAVSLDLVSAKSFNRADDVNANPGEMSEILAVDENKIYLVEVRQQPYQPDHQVELLHLQAEADALLLQLQTIKQKRLTKSTLLTVD